MVENSETMTTNTSLYTCYQWLDDMIETDNVTLKDINEAFRIRNLGGIIFVSVLMVIGLVGNLHVILIYALKFKISNYKIYILILASLDMTNCCLSMPLVIMYLSFPFMFPSNIFCKVFRFILYYVSISSTIILVVIAVDRFRKICKPMKFQLTVFHTKMLCMIVLFVTLCVTWPVPVLYGNSTVHTGIAGITGTRCFTLDEFKDTNYQAQYNALLTVVFIVITLILAILYYRIVRDVRQHNKIRWECQRSRSSRINMSHKQHSIKAAKTTITLFAVTVGYVASALPHHALAMLIFIKKDLDCILTFEQGFAYYMFVWIFLTNNCINPIIYGFSDSRFRREIKKFYHSVFRSTSKEEHTPSASLEIHSNDIVTDDHT